MSFRYHSNGFLILIAAFVLVAAQATAQTQTDREMGTLVTAEWLSQHLDDPDIVVLDCTVHVVPKEGGGFKQLSGRAEYESGHIPSAGFADLMGDLSDPDSPLNFAMPTPERFCAAMGALGVGDDTKVVLYDGLNSVWAARVWWMLRWVGFDHAALLDGGLAVWKAGERPLSTEAANRKTKKLTPKPRPELIAYQDEVVAAVKDDAVTLIDAMPEPHYKGQMVMYGRAGHIPGAINVSAMALIDETGRYRPHDELAAMYDGDKKARVITYCGAGVAASSVAFVLTRLGYTNVAVYMASLQEWAADPDKPLVVD